MTRIKPDTIRYLRYITGAGLYTCKKALIEHEGNLQAAYKSIRAQETVWEKKYGGKR